MSIIDLARGFIFSTIILSVPYSFASVSCLYGAKSAPAQCGTQVPTCEVFGYCGCSCCPQSGAPRNCSMPGQPAITCGAWGTNSNNNPASCCSGVQTWVPSANEYQCR